jgi:hypothetical protein
VCAAVFGVGLPLGWVWVASHLQTTVGQQTSDVAAVAAIFGPPASYFALIFLAGRVSRRRGGVSQPQRMAWNRSRDDERPGARHVTALEQVVLVATLLVLAGFEVWFFFFAHEQSWGS